MEKRHKCMTVSTYGERERRPPRGGVRERRPNPPRNPTHQETNTDFLTLPRHAASWPLPAYFGPLLSHVILSLGFTRPTLLTRDASHKHVDLEQQVGEEVRVPVEALMVFGSFIFSRL